jgi:23S rRNA (guanosine2251-2'-O)-methyltransferase
MGRIPPGALRPHVARNDVSADLLVGVNPILEQLRRDPRMIRKVVVARGAHEGASRVAAAARSAGVEVEHADPSRLRTLARGLVHQGVVAWREASLPVDWHALLERRPPCLLVADQVTDPRNLGALLRSAEATGVGGVILPRSRAAGVTPVVAKASAGAAAFVPVARVANLVRALEDLKQGGYWVVGLEGSAAQSVFDFAFPELCALVVGGEGRGLRSLTRAHCDHLVSIPMLGRVDSLNVSVAAALALYERVRQAIRQTGVNGLTPREPGGK